MSMKPSKRGMDLKVLVICRAVPGVTAADMGQHYASEASELRRLREEGTLLDAFSPGGPGAVLVVEASGASSAADIAWSLPMRKANLITTEVIELHPLNL
jgi:hypothetical protein